LLNNNKWLKCQDSSSTKDNIEWEDKEGTQRLRVEVSKPCKEELPTNLDLQDRNNFKVETDLMDKVNLETKANIQEDNPNLFRSSPRNT
jgi:hypothetical protein